MRFFSNTTLENEVCRPKSGINLYPGGMQMSGRTWNGTADRYRFSHNGHEREDAIFEGAQSAEYWMYDSRILRRWNVDPIIFPWQSPYMCFNGNPIYFADPSGATGEDPPATNSKGSVIGTSNDPVDLNEVDIVTPKVEPNMPSATTGNGPGNSQPLPTTPKEESTPPGVYHENTWEITYNPNPRAASNNNTTDISSTRYLGTPSDKIYMERARNLLNNGGGDVSVAGFKVNTDFEVSYGKGSLSFGTNGKGSVTSDYGKFGIDANSGSVSSYGYGKVNINGSGFSAGPISASSSSQGYVIDYNIVKMGGVAIGTVNTNVVVKSMEAVVVGGLSTSIGIVVQNYTNTAGGVGTRTIGTVETISAKFSANIGGVGVGLNIPLKSK